MLRSCAALSPPDTSRQPHCEAEIGSLVSELSRLRRRSQSACQTMPPCWPTKISIPRTFTNPVQLVRARHPCLGMRCDVIAFTELGLPQDWQRRSTAA